MKICFFDLDGTLLSDKKSISDYTIRALKKLHNNGVLIGYITSRTKRNINTILYNAPCDFLATYDGALIEVYEGNRKKTILNECINNNVAHLLIEQLLSLKDVDVFAYFEPFYLYNNSITCSEECRVLTYDKNTKKSLLDCQRIRGRAKHSKSSFDLISHYDEVSYYYENNDIVFHNKKVNKGNAVSCILDYYKIDSSDAICFGDSEADIDMFKQCKLSFAMENSNSKVKENATYITKSNNNDGVAIALFKLLKKEN